MNRETEKNRRNKKKRVRYALMVLGIAVLAFVIVGAVAPLVMNFVKNWQADRDREYREAEELRLAELKDRSTRWDNYLHDVLVEGEQVFEENGLTVVAASYNAHPSKIAYFLVSMKSQAHNVTADFIRNQTTVQRFLELAKSKGTSVVGWKSQYPYWVHGTGSVNMPEKDGYYCWYYMPSFMFAEDDYVYVLMFDSVYYQTI
jgi:hypothetical protein